MCWPYRTLRLCAWMRKVRVSFHPVIAVGCQRGDGPWPDRQLLLDRTAGEPRHAQANAPFAEKGQPSLADGAEAPAHWLKAGAACVTVIEDREAISTNLALQTGPCRKPGASSSGSPTGRRHLSFCQGLMNGMKQAGMAGGHSCRTGRKARQAELFRALGKVEIRGPRAAQVLWRSAPIHNCDARQSDGDQSRQRRSAGAVVLDTTIRSTTSRCARHHRLLPLARTIDNCSRTMKTKGSMSKALRQEQDGPLEKLVTRPDGRHQGDAARREREGKAPPSAHRRLRIPAISRRSNVFVKASKANRKTKNPHSQRLACLCGMGLLQAWRLDRLLRKTRSHLMLRA